MKTKMITIPFDLELAKEIQAGVKLGKIVTRDEKDVRILCWDRKSEVRYIIVALVDRGDFEDAIFYATNGDSCRNVDQYDLMLQVPEWAQYKDGDIIAFSKYRDEKATIFHIGIFKKITAVGADILHDNYVCYDMEYHELAFDGKSNYLNSSHYATAKEKQFLIDRLKSSIDPRAREYLKRFFGIDKKPGYEFQPKDWVLCQNFDEWCLCQFSHTAVSHDRLLTYVAVGGGAYYKCIPYNDQTKHLLGTTDKWDE